MSASLMSSVEPDRIADAQPLDRSGEIGVSGVEKYMKVVLHEDIGMDLQFESFDHLAKGIKKSNIIFLIPKDFPSFISTGQHVVKRIRVVDPERPGHKYTIHLYASLSRK